jgi:hypothetical protein
MTSALVATLQWLVGIGFFWALLLQLLRWRMDLFVRCAEKPEAGVYAYTCALHNAEESDLRAPFAVEVAIEEDAVGFASAPNVFVDPVNRPSSCRVELRRDSRDSGNPHLPDQSPRREVLVIEADGMRSKETWFVRFGTRASPNNVALRVVSREGAGHSTWAFPIIQRQELRPAGIGSYSTGSGTSRNATRIIVGVFSAWFYLWTVVQRSGGWGAPRNWVSVQSLVDLAIAGALFAAAFLVMQMSWRLGAPFIQGYLDEREDLQLSWERCHVALAGNVQNPQAEAEAGARARPAGL